MYGSNSRYVEVGQDLPVAKRCLSEGCVGGYARVKTIVEQQRPGKKHSLFLNAGDEFQVWSPPELSDALTENA